MRQTRNPTLAALLNRALDTRLGELRVSVPARVERYDATKQLVDVKPLVKDPVSDVDTGDISYVSVPVIVNVPVAFPGAGGFRITFPISLGDTVLLVFSDRSLDKWLDQGGEVSPDDSRVHNLSDAVAYPGIRPFNAPWTGASTTNATVGKDGGPQIHLTGSEIQLGAPATEALLKGTQWKAAFDTWRAALNVYLAALATLNPVTIGAAATTYGIAETAFASSLATVLSTTVKTS